MFINKDGKTDRLEKLVILKYEAYFIALGMVVCGSEFTVPMKVC